MNPLTASMLVGAAATIISLWALGFLGSRPAKPEPAKPAKPAKPKEPEPETHETHYPKTACIVADYCGSED